MHHPPVQPAAATSPYLRLREAVRPAIFAQRLLAGDAERARSVTAECEELLMLTRELIKAVGRVQLLDPGPVDVLPAQPGVLSGSRDVPPAQPGAPPRPPSSDISDLPEISGVPGSIDRQTRLLDAYADAGMGWAKVVGSLMALAGTLLDRGDWEDVRRLADVLAEAGESYIARDLRAQLAKAVWETYQDQLQRITDKMSPADIRSSIAALRTILLETPEDFADRNRDVNRFLAPLAASIYAIMRGYAIEIPHDSRVDHIASGGVARYPEIVRTSLDELSAEFEDACQVISRKIKAASGS